MDYISVMQQDNNIILTGIKNFIPEQVLDCGQCFRWRKNPDLIGGFTGVAHGHQLEVYIEDDGLVLKNTSKDDFDKIWRDYFDLSRNYSELHLLYSEDVTLRKAIAHSPGLRLMRQDPWETLVTFILSQNSNIPRIKGMVELLCENFGDFELNHYNFPEPEKLAKLSDDDLAPVRSGYRAEYILDAAKKVAEGSLDLKKLNQDMSCGMPTEEARQALMRVRGVGPKVADCVLLYGFGRVECYPLDVWMKRVMAKYYPKGFPESVADTAGIAQQFLFHYERVNN